LVEQRIENPRVGGSIPPLATKYKNEIKGLATAKPFFFCGCMGEAVHFSAPAFSRAHRACIASGELLA
jgi:hypothetical protein